MDVLSLFNNSNCDQLTLQQTEIKNKIKSYLLSGNFGIEKEHMRMSKDKKISQTKHPFTDKRNHRYISTDFCESQVEMVTPMCKSVSEAYNFLINIHNVVVDTIAQNGEWLWQLSNPPSIISDDEIIIDSADTSNDNVAKYKEYLSKKYCKKMQLYCGIHFNFSFDKQFMNLLYELNGGLNSYFDFKNEYYLKLAKYCEKYSWFIVHLTGASPVFHNSFLDEKKLFQDNCFINYSSMRNGIYGYRNNKQVILDYSGFEQYCNSVEKLINNGELYSIAENYNHTRLKTKGKYSLDNLKKSGFEYIELRMIDLNPLEYVGISKDDLDLIHLLIVYFATKEDFIYSKNEQKTSYKNHINASKHSNDKKIRIDGDEYTKKEATIVLLSEMLSFYDIIQNNDAINLILSKLNKIRHSEKSYSDKVIDLLKTQDYTEYGYNLANKYYNDYLNEDYRFFGSEDMELSTQSIMKACLKFGIKYEILDKTDNFLRLKNDDIVKYVREANKTDMDNYVTTLIMSNKKVTKKILQENNFNVPQGWLYTDMQNAIKDYSKYANSKIVIKPKSTDCGLGISIFNNTFNVNKYNNAIKIAFSYDKNILIEQYIEGSEYRFHIIGEQVIAILKRVPTNVIGDGGSTIRELIKEKNKNPRRGEKHKKPLTKIEVGLEENLCLQTQGLSIDDVIETGKIVYLRKNSNISTGGDGYDCTDEINKSYCDIALNATQCVGAKFCGVDIIIQNINETANSNNHSIIELNFNPSIWIHCYPSKGKSRPVAEKTVQYLFNLDDNKI